MENYICIDGKQIELSEVHLKALRGLLPLDPVSLSELAPGDCFMVGPHEMVVLDHISGGTWALRKNLLADDEEFGSGNNYDGSNVDKICNQFAEELAGFVGEDGLLAFDVDLTSDDGLKDYGIIQRRAALLTADQCRRYVEILDQHKLDEWRWLATAYSTPRHENDRWVKCVSPSGLILNGNVGYHFCVRPFCIFDSSIFVSR